MQEKVFWGSSSCEREIFPYSMLQVCGVPNLTVNRSRRAFLYFSKLNKIWKKDFLFHHICSALFFWWQKCQVYEIKWVSRKFNTFFRPFSSDLLDLLQSADVIRFYCDFSRQLWAKWNFFFGCVFWGLAKTCPIQFGFNWKLNKCFAS